MNIHNKETLNF